MFGASSPGVLRADRGDSVAEERKTPFSRPEAGEEGGGGGVEFDEEQSPGSAMLSLPQKIKRNPARRGGFILHRPPRGSEHPGKVIASR